MQDDAIVAVLESAYTGAIYDAMRELGLAPGILPDDVKPVNQRVRVGSGRRWKNAY